MFLWPTSSSSFSSGCHFRNNLRYCGVSDYLDFIGIQISQINTNIKSSVFCSRQSTWGTAPSLWCRPWRGGPCPGCWCTCRCSMLPPGSRPPAAQSWSWTRPRPGNNMTISTLHIYCCHYLPISPQRVSGVRRWRPGWRQWQWGTCPRCRTASRSPWTPLSD